MAQKIDMNKWQYIYLDYNPTSTKDIRVDSSLPLAERLQQRIQKAFDPKSLIVYLPDESVNIIQIDPMLVERSILQVLNSLGNEGWEAFYCSREKEGERIQWALKRLIA